MVLIISEIDRKDGLRRLLFKSQTNINGFQYANNIDKYTLNSGALSTFLYILQFLISIVLVLKDTYI